MRGLSQGVPNVPQGHVPRKTQFPGARVPRDTPVGERSLLS